MSVVERNHAIRPLLCRFMPLPQHQDDITRSRRRHREPDGVSPRVALVNLSISLHSFENLSSNVGGVL